MLKNKFQIIFSITFLVFLVFFIIRLIYDKNYSGFDSFIFQNFFDYFADFFNHAKISEYGNVYNGPIWSLAERGLPPLHYVLFTLCSNFANWASVPTLFENGFSFPAQIAKCVFVGNYLLCCVSILYFIYLYEKLNMTNKYLKFFIIIGFIISVPFIHEYERGNAVILAVFAVSIYLFNYDSFNKYKRYFSLLALGFAIALKIFPLFFMILLFQEKRYRDCFLVFLIVISFFTFGFIYLGGNFVQNILFYIINMYVNMQTYHYASHHLILIMLVLIVFGNLFIKQKWKMCLTIVLIILTVSHSFMDGYRLMYLLPITVMFLNKSFFSKIDYLYGTLLILMISPIDIISSIYTGKMLSVLLFLDTCIDTIKVLNKSKLKKT